MQHEKKIRHKLVVLGDSITYGYPYGPEFSWVTLLAQKSGRELVNRGINGDTTDGMRARFERDVVADKPDAVLILGGLNDVFQSVDVQHFYDNLLHLIEQSRRHDILPVMGIEPPVGSTAEPEFQNVWKHWAEDLLPKVIRDTGVPWFDLYQPMLQDGIYISDYTCDGVHLSLEGNRFIAGEIFRQLQNNKVL
ncbi:MAG TPA: GDSL-type esterase/lipase family protein [Patescibacteria group bacterium]|nr:GDSL-type esterase/lipase family protein [Patescibacteria group bacterium]